MLLGILGKSRRGSLFPQGQSEKQPVRSIASRQDMATQSPIYTKWANPRQTNAAAGLAKHHNIFYLAAANTARRGLV